VEQEFPNVETFDGLCEGWRRVEEMWSVTMAAVSALPEPTLHRSVNDEWSFVETLRHLVFVSDSWVRRAVLGEEHAYDRLSYPPDFAVDVRPWGIDVTAKPSFAEIAVVRRDRVDAVRSVVDALTLAEFGRTTTVGSAPGFPPPGSTFTVGFCLGVVVNEERFHHGFATRDLALLGA
jgi:hypothetical protein